MNFNDAMWSFFRGSGARENMDHRDDASDDLNNRDPFQGFRFFHQPPGGFNFGSHAFRSSSDNADEDDDEDDISNDEGPPGRGGPFPEGGLLFSFDNEVGEMFRHFDELFKNFGLADFPPIGVPRIEQTPPGNPDSVSPRDEMLKEPDSEQHAANRPSSPAASKEPLPWFDALRKGKTPLFIPPDADINASTSKREDSDLDSVVRRRENDPVFRGRSPEHPAQRDHQRPCIRSYSRSVSIQTIRKPDGTTETRRTEQDDKGNVTTTVTTTQDDTPRPSCTRPGRHGISWPRRGRDTGPPERGHTQDSMYQKFFGSWFKN